MFLLKKSLLTVRYAICQLDLMQNLSHHFIYFLIIVGFVIHKQIIDIKAKITKGVAAILIISQPNCEEFALQFINQPEVIDDSATKPKTKKSFIP